MIQAGTIRIGSGCTFSPWSDKVLDQLDQLVAIYHLAGRCGDRLADDEIAGRRPAMVRGRDISRTQSLQKFCQPRTKLSPPLFERFSQHFRIGRGKIGRRHHVQHLPDRKLDDRLVAASRRRARPWSCCATIVRPSRKACAIRLNGGCSPSGRPKRLSCGCGLISDHGPCPGEKKRCEASKKRLVSTRASCAISIRRCG